MNKEELMAAILPHLREAVKHRAACWDAEREIEKLLGSEDDELSEYVSTLAAALDAPDSADTKVGEAEVEELLNRFEEGNDD